MNVSRLRVIFFVNFKLCFIEVYTNIIRSFITSFGIFLAVTSLLFNLAFIRGMDDDLRNRLERIGGLNILTVNTIKPESREEKIAFQQSPGLSIAEAKKIIQDIPYIKNLLAFRDLGWRRCKAVGKRTWAKFIAINHEYIGAFNYSVSSGVMLSKEDILSRSNVCVIGTRLKKQLFGENQRALGKILFVENIPLKVIGIIYTENERNQRSRECLFPYSIFASRMSNASRNLNEISFVLEDSGFSRPAISELNVRFHASHRGVKDFEIEANVDKIKEMESASLGLKIIFWSIAAISLIVGGISITNIMFATIGDRIREIGIRKALGAKKYDIFTQFLIEAILVCFIGGLPGLILGTTITLIPEGELPYIPHLVLTDYLMTIFFTLGAGIFSGLFPALRAAKMQPVEALAF
jgi:ABC-type antimicrobial peptide transport system permease subunit